MNFKALFTVAALALSGFAAQAQVNVFNTAFLEPIPPGPGTPSGGVSVQGFGRNTSLDEPGAVSSAVGAATPFFDTWNLGTAGVTPGVYTFSNMVVDAFGGSTFASVTFNSYNAALVRNTVLFSVNAAGTQAVGSGTFTVLGSCPVVSCVWIDVVGLAPTVIGSGYGGSTVAVPIPEPGTYALMALGLAGLAAAVRRRRA